MALTLSRKDIFVRDTSLNQVLTEFELPLDYERFHNFIGNEHIELLLSAVVDKVVNHGVLLGFHAPAEGILHQVSQLVRGITSVQLLEAHA